MIGVTEIVSIEKIIEGGSYIPTKMNYVKLIFCFQFEKPVFLNSQIRLFETNT